MLIFCSAADVLPPPVKWLWARRDVQCCPVWVFIAGFGKTKTSPDASKCTFLKNPAVPM